MCIRDRCGIVRVLLSVTGPVNGLFHTGINFMTLPEAFRPIYIISGIWQGAGWSSIMYTAALSNASQELKEAAKTDPKAAEEWQALKEKEAVARQRKKEREEERMAADPEYAAMMAERKAEYTRTRTAKRQAEREALVELAKTDEEAAKKLAEMRKYQSQATVRSYQKMKADAEAGDPDAIKRYETTLAKRREEYHRKKGA